MSTEIIRNFDLAMQEIEAIPLSNDLEISAENIPIKVDPEKAAILFELAELSIEDPNYEKRFSTIDLNKPNVKIKSTKLQQELAKVEEALRRPMGNLKVSNLWVKKSEPSYKMDDKESEQLNLRLNFAVDGLVMIFLSLGLTSLYLLIFEPDYVSYPYFIWNLSSVEFLFYLTVFLPIWTLMMVLYPMVLLSCFGQTISDAIFDYKVIGLKGSTLKMNNIIFRSVSTPLSIALAGYLGLFFDTRTLHDYIAGTKIVKKK